MFEPMPDASATHFTSQRFPLRPSTCSFHVSWARSEGDVAEAQRLRFSVFMEELGARSKRQTGDPPAHDIDNFDVHCQHLLVRASGGCRHGDVIATCRLLTPEGAARAGGLYTHNEFDLEPLRDLLPHTLEMGRVCIDPAWRNGLLVMAMWKAVGEQMVRRNLDCVLGCTSISLCDHGELAARLWHRLKATHLVPAGFRIRPKAPLELISPKTTDCSVPPLMKAYLRCGGRLLGPPALDPDFNTADFPMIAHLGDLPSRYVKRVIAGSP